MSSIIKIDLEDCVPLDTSEVLFGENFHPEPKIIRPSELTRRGAVHIILANPRPRRSVDDNSVKSEYASSMNDITREEIDTKLQLIEERLDRKVSDIAKSVSDFQDANQRTVDALQNAKWWAIGTAIAVLAVFMGTLQWGLSAQKEENARFSSYIREDIKSIGDDAREISKAVTEMKIRAEAKSEAPKN